jgi:hypothetical protein
MNKWKVFEVKDCLEINLVLNDSRYVDAHVALGVMCRDRNWKLREHSREPQIATFEVLSLENFLASVNLSYGWEPPTRVLISNKKAGEENYWRASRDTTLAVAEAFVTECGHRGLLSDRETAKALAELRTYETEVTRHG